jgi:uncharacterized protein YgiM (DUF1202 family)
MRANHIVLLCLLPVYAASAEGVAGKVMASLLNVRAKPSTKFSVLCQIPNGDTVTVLFEEDGWYNIAAPAHSAAWISGSLLGPDGKVARGGDVFAGPSASHTVYAKLAAGAEVEVKNRRSDNWLQIAVPESATAWVSARYIEAEDVPQVAATPPLEPPVPDPVPEPAPVEPVVEVKPPGPEVAKPEVKPEPEVVVAPPAPKPQVKPVETVIAEPPAPEVKPAEGAANEAVTVAINAVDIDLPAVVPKDIRVHPISFEPQGKEVNFIGEPKLIEKAGVVLRLAEKGDPRAFVIAMRVHDTYYPVAYLQSDSEKLEEWEFHRARVFGTQRVVDEWPRPLIQVDRIEKLNP